MNIGLFHRRNFLDQMLCADLCKEMAAIEGYPAMVATDGSFHVDESVRRTIQKQPRAELVEKVRESLSAVKPAIERAFGVEVSSPGMPRFLCYRPGDYFRKHADTSEGKEISPEVARRFVSAVIFLNAPGLRRLQGEYTGGRLVLHHVPGLGTRTSLTAEAGLLVAFPSTALHEVTRIRSGIRMTAVAWFDEASDNC